MKKWLFGLILFFGALIISVKSQSTISRSHPVFDSLNTEQLIVVVTDNWNNIRARLYCYERVKGRWLIQFSFPAVVGKKGLALGEGIIALKIANSPTKTEGDLRSPAGIFKLGPAFGYAEKSQAAWIHLPYIRATDTLICVDDGVSKYYNQLIKTVSETPDWKSHENMHRADDDYKWGLFVQHNADPVKQGKGSCIFLHIWENAGEGTAGCTAMEEKNIVKLLQWIQAEKNPLLVQLPVAEFKKLQIDYKLPDL